MLTLSGVTNAAHIPTRTPTDVTSQLTASIDVTATTISNATPQESQRSQSSEESQKEENSNNANGSGKE